MTLARFFAPLVERDWIATGTGSAGAYRCTRRFRRVLGNKFVQMDVDWKLGKKSYQELAMFGVDRADKRLKFWSFTSDGKRSIGVQVEPRDLAAGGLAFEAEMPAGTARFLMWPVGEGLHVAVESKTKKGWNRFLLQTFRAKR